MIQGVVNSGAIPVLERMLQFTSARHTVLTGSIANFSTPLYLPDDLDPAEFQATLRQALDERRRRPNPTEGPLNMQDTRELRFEKDRITTRPQHADWNILFHDRNNRDVERTMQALVENTMAHNASVEMLRNEFEMLRLAIRERV